jgi:anti-sigma factor ChrR (cupin superfamily)
MPEGMMTTGKRLLANEPSPPSSFVDVVNAPWETGIEHKVLYHDPNTGIATLLFRLASDAIVPLHEHAGVEMTYVLEGSLEDEEGVCTAGNFVWRPAGNTHEARAPHGALILSVFMSPNHFAAGQTFFSEEKPG